eukprot:CAMPEP_0196168600 /NCGR_PEP_ID=MMETSP0911-20130528/3301_1 /TAXON_ID=49265 /ORGANISM="Thalassiosira rotula, Strain GSO102" /LENGTH=495 /DNA_ID=CAMNT_0041434615 /DNA_START=78 /DNA_END=1565 /DNA_ORIENTATION=-
MMALSSLLWRATTTTYVPAARRRVARIESRSLAIASNAASAAWRERVQQWQTTLTLAENGDASAMCDVGWAKHHGLVPSSTPSSPSSVGKVGGKAVKEALKYYKQSAALGYAPASSLLGDLYFYGMDETRDWNEARTHLEKVLEDTDEDEGEDAYVRMRALRKLGSIAAWEGGDSATATATATATTATATTATSGARDYLTEALATCRTHLGGNFAFLLSHDPPGDFYSHLEAEAKIADDHEALGGKLAGFVTARGWEPRLEDFVSLRAYTRRVREVERSDGDFASEYFREGLGRFAPSAVVDASSPSDGGGEWGITFLPSLFRVYGHPLVQEILREKAEGGGEAPPSLVVLGSALGNCAVWPALAFGFRATGFDILESCVRKTNDDIIASLKGNGAARLRDLVKFEVANVLSDADRVEPEMKAASVVWSNDHEWGEAAQRKVEEMAYANMSEGSCLVLYRPPLTLQDLRWKAGVKIPNIATSWNPRLTMYLLKK